MRRHPSDMTGGTRTIEYRGFHEIKPAVR